MPNQTTNTAWNRGYDSPPNARCPYDSPALFGLWIQGATAASEDRIAGREPRWWEAKAGRREAA